MADRKAIDLVEAFFAVLDRRDGSALAALLGEDVVYDTGHGERIIGAQETRDALIARAGALDETHGDIVAMVSGDGRRAAAEVTLRGKHMRPVEGLPSPSQASFSLSAGFFFEIEGASIVRVTRLYDQQALAGQLSGR